MATAIYATVADVRPLLGNLRTQISDTEINLAIASASAEVNLRTARKIDKNADDTDPQLQILKAATRYLTAWEVLGGVQDMQDDREDYKERAYEMLDKLLALDIAGKDDIVTSSEYVTFPAKEINGLLYSLRHKDLKKSKGSANSVSLLGSMD